MKEFDLYAALTDVDDRFVLEAAETETNPRSKWRGIQRAAIATIAAGVVAVVGITVGSALKNQTPAGNKTVKEDVSITKRWADQPNYEKYSELTINGVKYTGSAGVYEGQTGQSFGEFTVTGLDYGDVVFVSDEKTVQTGPVVSETTLSGTWVAVESQSVPEPTTRETTVLAYEIPGIDPSFAVAVKFPDEEQYYVYGNALYAADTYSDFATGIQLLQYTDLIGIILHTETGEQDVSGAYGTIRELLEELFAEESIPVFTHEELPSDFGGCAYMPNDPILTAPNRGTGTTILIVSDDVLEFLQNKEFGELCAEIGVDYRLLGQQNIGIRVYSGGFVTTNIGWTEKTFYVGEECVTSFIQALGGN